MRKHGQFDKRVTINLTLSDYAELREHAHERGHRLAPFVREAALAQCREAVVIPPELPRLINRLQTDVKRIGTNVNQIARHTNIAQRVSFRQIYKTRKFVEDLDQATKTLRTVIHNLSV